MCGFTPIAMPYVLDTITPLPPVLLARGVNAWSLMNSSWFPCVRSRADGGSWWPPTDTGTFSCPRMMLQTQKPLGPTHFGSVTLTSMLFSNCVKRSSEAASAREHTVKKHMRYEAYRDVNI